VINMVVTIKGRQVLRNLAINASNEYFQYIAVGTGSSTLTGSENTLGNEAGRYEVSGTSTGAPASATSSIFIPSTDMSGLTLNEVGIATLVSGGSICTRTNFSGLDKDIYTEVWIDYGTDFEDGGT